LPDVYGEVVLRIAPFPSGALHLGNMKTFLLNYLYAEKYKGNPLRTFVGNKYLNGYSDHLPVMIYLTIGK
jgi:hypothetical protein